MIAAPDARRGGHNRNDEGDEMGYAQYTLADGREAGYAAKDVCNEKECTKRIDRGLGYLCGDTPGGDEFGCGGYFCAEHLWMAPEHLNLASGQLCAGCMKRHGSDTEV